MKKAFVLMIFIFIQASLFSQQNSFFIKLSQKELASFNDAIMLMRIAYNDKDEEDIFIENILWAAGKKLFQVMIPIKPDKINPLITRKEFAYWCCEVFNLRQEKVRSPLSRYDAYKICVNLGVLSPGRGVDDSFSGQELLDTYAYLLYYVKNKNILTNDGDLEILNSYEYLPDWRKKLYRELDAQREDEKKRSDKKWKEFLDKFKKTKKEEVKRDNEIKEKFIDNTGDITK